MLQVTTEDRQGSECSGSDGDLNRVLVLNNTFLTIQDGFVLALGGFVLNYGTDYTVSHLNANSTVTFLIAVKDVLPITILYFSTQSSSALTPQFSQRINAVRNIIYNHGQTATLTRTINNLDTMGGVTSYSNTDYSIKWYPQAITEKDRNLIEMGLAVSGDAKAFFYPYYSSVDTGVAGPDIVITVGDIITDTNSIKWRIEQKLGGRIADATEIFSVGIVRRMDLTA